MKHLGSFFFICCFSAGCAITPPEVSVHYHQTPPWTTQFRIELQWIAEQRLRVSAIDSAGNRISEARFVLFVDSDQDYLPSETDSVLGFWSGTGRRSREISGEIAVKECGIGGHSIRVWTEIHTSRGSFSFTSPTGLPDKG